MLRQYRHQSKIHSRFRLVGGSSRVPRRCETDLGVGGVEDTVEALEEGLTVDKVKTLSRWCTEVVDDTIDRGGSTANVRVERSWPDLSVGGQCIRDLEVRYEDETFDRKSRVWILTEPMLKFKFWRLSYWVVVNFSKPVFLSYVAPVADWYAE